MSLKSIIISTLMTLSLGAHAIPPVAPPAIYNTIKAIAARNCKTVQGEILVKDLKDTDQVKFVLKLNKEGTQGILTILEDGNVSENLDVICK
jgi:hypothetical protein